LNRKEKELGFEGEKYWKSLAQRQVKKKKPEKYFNHRFWERDRGGNLEKEGTTKAFRN